MTNRRKITSLLSATIRDIRHDERGFLVKVHSGKLKRSFWIGLDFDGVWDEDGNEFENNADFMPTVLREPAGLKSGLTRTEHRPLVATDRIVKAGTM